MPRAIDSGLVYDLPTLSDAQVSPDGAAIAYVRSKADRERLRAESRIEVVPFEGGEPRALTRGPNDSHPRWSPDGSRLAFLRAPESEGGSGGSRERKPSQVWLLDLAGGEPRRLTDLREGVSSFAWRPDGGGLVAVGRVDPDRPSEEEERRDPKPPRVRVLRGRIRYRGDGEGWFGEARTQLFAVDADGGEAKQLTRAPHNHSRPAVSPDGSTLAFLSSDRSRQWRLREPMGSEVCTMPAEGGRLRQLATGLWSASALEWSPDGRQLAFLAVDRPTGQAYVHTVDVESGEVRRISDDSISPLGGALAWRGGRILVLADSRGESSLYALTPGGRCSRLLDGSGTASPGPASVSRDGRRAARLAGTTTRPPEVHAVDVPAGSERAVTSATREYLEGREVADAERVTVRRLDAEIDGWLMFPPGFDAARRYPLVLSVHGGPHSAFGPRFTPVHQVLAAAGYLVLYVNPRGSTTYGAEFCAAVNADWGGEDYRDLMAAVDQVSERPYVDPGRLGVYGYSYGGYMSAWLACHEPRFKAFVVGAPVTDISNSFLTDDIGVALGDVEWGGTPWDREAWYRERSPLTHVRDVRAPVLLLHGEDDARCPIADSEAFYTALAYLGRPVEFVRFPGGSHGFPNGGHPVLRQEYLDRVVGWFERHMPAKPSRRRATPRRRPARRGRGE